MARGATVRYIPITALPHRALELYGQKFLSLDGELHGEAFEHLARVAVDDKPHGLLGGDAPLIAVEELVFTDFTGRRLVLNLGGGVGHIGIRESVRPAFVSHQKAVALAEVPCAIGPL